MKSTAKRSFAFEGRLFHPGGPRMMTVLPIPAEVTEQAGFRARTRVEGSIDGVPIATALQSSGEGWLACVVSKELLETLGRSAGDRVRAVLALDDGPIVVTLPRELEEALGRNPKARAAFERLSPSHRKEYARWVESGKRDETRVRRAAEAAAKIAAGKPFRTASSQIG